MNKKKIMASVIMSVFAVSAVFSGIMFYWQTNDQKKSAEDFDTLAQLIVEETPVIDELPVNEEEEPQTEAVLTAYEKYVEQYNLNNDFVGWISIADTAINYPVMQTVNNPDYYLKKNFVKKYSDYGVPYVDSDCSIDLSTNTVIYGHNMKNGSMFSSLVSYANKSYFEEHPIICFDTLGGYGEYQVIAAFRFDTKIGRASCRERVLRLV